MCVVGGWSSVAILLDARRGRSRKVDFRESFNLLDRDAADPDVYV